MNLSRTSFCLVCLLAVLFTLAATENVRADAKMVIQPQFETYGQYDSNFYRASENERAVYTYHLKPGFVFGVETPKSNLLLEYNLDAQWFDDKDDVPVGQEDSDEYDFVGHEFELSASSQVTDHLRLGIEDMFLKTREPGNSDIFNNMVERYKYYMNELTPGMTYQFTERLGVSLEYSNLITNYDDLIMEDSVENRGVVDLFYQSSSKNTLTVNYQYWTRDYDLTTPDYTSQQVMLSAMHSGRLFSLSGKIGVHDRSFDEDFYNSTPIDDIDILAWSVELSYQNPPEETERPKSSLMMVASRNLNDNGLGHQYFKATRLNADATYLLFNRLNLSVGGTYQTSDYETRDREDDYYKATLGVDYFINDDLTIGLESGYESRDSDAVGKNYRNKFALMRIAYQHNLGSR